MDKIQDLGTSSTVDLMLSSDLHCRAYLRQPPPTFIQLVLRLAKKKTQ